MKRFLRYELDRYLIGRAKERKKEMPLVLVENQPYIHYQKGSLVMYALQDYIGEANLNQALSDFLERVAFQEPPYTTSLQLLEHIRKVTPADYQYVLKDMFETITLFDNRTVSASFAETGTGEYEVHLQVASKKFRANELGVEKGFLDVFSGTGTISFTEKTQPEYLFRTLLPQCVSIMARLP